MQQPYPILEYDTDNDALINPHPASHPTVDMPDHCVLCFFHEVLTNVCEKGEAPVLCHLYSEVGHNPVYSLDVNGSSVAVVQPGVGAPMSAAILDELIALGCSKFIACGGAGVLDSEIVAGHLVIPNAAVRDEGTSYHYLPPSREVNANPAGVKAIEDTLTAHGIPYIVGKTWTNDAIYRETRNKVQMRRAEGCITVEMETAAFFAVAQFRGVTFGQILYGGDDVSGEQWDERDWIHGQASTREKLLWLAAEACLQL